MTVALLSIGDELLRGEIANSNAQWLADQLTLLGLRVVTIETVGDDHARLVATLRRLLDDHPIVIATGGLGPTSDDLTAAAVAEVLGVPLERSQEALDAITRRLAERGATLRPGHEKQAELPRGAEMLANSAGSAPGFAVRNGTSLFVLPGVPVEMRTVFEEQVLPRLQPAATHDSYATVIHTFGVGESFIAERLDGLAAEHPGVDLGFRAHDGEVDVRVSARAPDPGEARTRVEEVTAAIRARLGDCIYGEGDQTLSQLAGRSVRAKGWRLAVAESCTGGLIAQQLTSAPASDYFVGGAVTYANTAKTQLLGVSEDTLRGHGAVSAEVAAEMAEGARRAFGADVALSVTGIAGPTGATPDKPVGLVHWAVAHPGGTVVEHRVFPGDRVQIQQQAAAAALDLLRRTLTNGAHRG